MNTELRLNHKEQVQTSMAKVQKITGSQTCENNNMTGINIRKQCLEQDNNMLQEHIMEKQGMAWNYSTYNKSPLLSISQKGSEDMMAHM